MNTPTLMQSEEKRAPWNDKFKEIEVTISQTLSTTTMVIVPIDVNENNTFILEEVVRNQIKLPDDILKANGINCWIVDEMCVI